MELSIKDKFFFGGGKLQQINYRNCSPVFRETIGTVVLYQEELYELFSSIQRNYRRCRPVFRGTIEAVLLYSEELQKMQTCIQRNYRRCTPVFRGTIEDVLLCSEALQKMYSCIQRNYRRCNPVFRGTIGSVLLYSEELQDLYVLLYSEELQKLYSCIQRNYRRCTPVFRGTIEAVLLYSEELQKPVVLNCSPVSSNDFSLLAVIDTIRTFQLCIIKRLARRPCFWWRAQHAHFGENQHRWDSSRAQTETTDGEIKYTGCLIISQIYSIRNLTIYKKNISKYFSAKLQ